MCVRMRVCACVWGQPAVGEGIRQFLDDLDLLAHKLCGFVSPLWAPLWLSANDDDAFSFIYS